MKNQVCVQKEAAAVAAKAAAEAEAAIQDKTSKSTTNSWLLLEIRLCSTGSSYSSFFRISKHYYPVTGKQRPTYQYKCQAIQLENVQRELKH